MIFRLPFSAFMYFHSQNGFYKSTVIRYICFTNPVKMKMIRTLLILLGILSYFGVKGTESDPEKKLTSKDIQGMIRESQRMSDAGAYADAYRQAHLAAMEAAKIGRQDFQVKALHQAVRVTLENKQAGKKEIEQAYADLKSASDILDVIQINGLQLENKLLRSRLNKAFGAAATSSLSQESGSHSRDARGEELTEIRQEMKNLASKTNTDLEKQNAWLQKQLSLQQQTLDQMSSEQLKKELIFLRQNALIDSMNMGMVLDSIRLAQNEIELSKAASELKLEKSRRNQLIAVSGIFVLIALIILIQYFNSRRFNRTLKEKNAQIEAEKDRSEALLLNILPADIAEELKEKGEVSARSVDEVTVLFTDFKDFTAAAESLSPEELVHELNVCFKAFDEICEKYHIEKIKTIGDAFMAAGGLSETNNAEPADVIHAALEMQDFISRRSADRVKTGHKSFEMRIGIHTGPVVAGVVGVKKFQYDIWGDTVNTASRLEGVCEIGKVNISQCTYQKVQDRNDLRFHNRGNIEVKGKGAIAMHHVVRS